jgi:hypothetical protein
MASTLDRFLRGDLAIPSAVECRRYVEAEFGWPKIAGQIKTLYEKVAND